MRAGADRRRPRRRHGAAGLRRHRARRALPVRHARLVLWRDTVVRHASPRCTRRSFGMELSPLFLGVGFLVGPRIAGTCWPAACSAGRSCIPVSTPSAARRSARCSASPPSVAHARTRPTIWSRYVRYVGAGAVTAGGISVDACAPLPVMLRRAGARCDRSATPRARVRAPRTERDLPTAGRHRRHRRLLALALWLVPAFRPLLLATVSGACSSASSSSSSRADRRPGRHDLAAGLRHDHHGAARHHVLPRGARRRGPAGIAACITVGALVAISIALAGDLAQDLKTGALLGATPRALQIGEMIGVVAAALARRLGALPPARRLHARLSGAARAAGQADGDARDRRHGRQAAVGAAWRSAPCSR